MTKIVAQIDVLFFFVSQHRKRQKAWPQSEKSEGVSLTVSKSLDVNLHIKTRYSFGLCSALPFHNFTNSFYGFCVFRLRQGHCSFATQATQVNNKDAVQIVCFRKKQCEVNREKSSIIKRVHKGPINIVKRLKIAILLYWKEKSQRTFSLQLAAT